MAEFGLDGVIRRLEQLDDDLLSCMADGIHLEITIVGGSALMLLGLSVNYRMTTDIDVIEASAEIERLLERYDMNRDVETFSYRLPENWKSRRLKVLFDGMVLDVYSPSPEDLAILKLIAYRDIDQKDLSVLLVGNGLDLQKLQAIIDNDTELRINFDSEEEWSLFLSRFNELKKQSKELQNETA